MASRPRQNYNEESEAGVNKQINMELFASYTYLAMSYHFDRDDVALKGFAKYFKKASDEEREHAQKLMVYQNKRGGRIVLQDVSKPKGSWDSGLDAMMDALQLEKDVNKALLDLHEIAQSHGDSQMTDYLEGEFLAEQVEAIKELSDHITNLTRVGTGLGEYLFDKNTLGD